MRADNLTHRIVRHFKGAVSARGGNFPAPGHGPHNRAYSISPHPTNPDDVLVYCHNGDDALAFKSHLRAIGLLPSRSGSCRNSAPVSCVVSPDDGAKRTANALALWRLSSLAKADGIVGAYLRSRAITLLPPSSLRFHPKCFRRNLPPLPAMVAIVTVPTTGEQRAVHLVFLRPDGSGKADLPRDQPQKISRGPTRGAAVVLGDLTGTDRAILEGEGIETVLSACLALNRPGIATLSIASLGRAPLPIGRGVVILADRGADDATEKAAQLRLSEGRRVWIATPAPAFKDFNDQLRAEGVAAVRASLIAAREIARRIVGVAA